MKAVTKFGWDKLPMWHETWGKPFEGKSISFWVRYGLEGNRSPQSAEAVAKRRAEMRTWLKGKFKGRRLLKKPRDHYK